jgi:non-ribosomal peptide synthetase component F
VTVAGLLERVRGVVLAAQEHQDLPFEHVVELVNPVRSLAYTPLFQVMFAWNNTEAGDLMLPGVQADRLASGYEAAKFDLTLSLAEQDGRIVGGIGYASALFDAGTVQRFGRYLQRVLRQLVEQPESRVAGVGLLDEAERRQVLVEGNQTSVHPADQTIHARFEAQAARDPHALAVLYQEQSLTYGQLNTRANQLAHYLHARGIGPDHLVGICLERSAEMLVSVLAVLKAGGAYLPLDPANPPERLAFMVRDSAPAVVITHGPARESLQASRSGCRCLRLGRSFRGESRSAGDRSYPGQSGVRDLYLGFDGPAEGCDGRAWSVGRDGRCLGAVVLVAAGSGASSNGRFLFRRVHC